MQTLSEIKALLESRGLSPRHAFGQNFLIDHNLIRKLVDTSGVGGAETVLEVGPGTGTLTEELLSRGCRVIACEIDRGLCELLRERFRDAPGFTLIEGDCLQSKRGLAAPIRDALTDTPFVLVSNLPYGVGTPLMLTLLIEHRACRGLYVTVQREVAERIAAAPGTKAYGTLSVVAQAAAEVEMIARLPPECFWPRPDVTSAMVAVRRRARPLASDLGRLAAFCQTLFEKRRKQLGAVLGRERSWPPGIRPEDRAEALSVDQLIALWAHRGGRAENAECAEGRGAGEES